MKLTVETIKKITLGAVRVEEKDGRIKLFRFTKEQENLYEKVAPDFYVKNFCTSGIRMEFITDSKELGMKFYLKKGCTRNYYAVQVFVNGKVLHTERNYRPENMVENYAVLKCDEQDTSGFCVNLPDGEKTVEILLPWSFILEIEEMTLTDGAKIEPIKPTLKWLFLGDSITQGYDSLLPSDRYAYRLAKKFNAEEINKAIGGEVIRPDLASLKDEFMPDVITVAYGTNDWSKGVTEDSFYSDYLKFLENLRFNYPSAKIFTISPIWRGDFELEKPLGEFKKVGELIKKASDKVSGIVYIDGFDLVPHDEKLFGDLRLHPSDEGFKHYAENLYKKLKNFL